MQRGTDGQRVSIVYVRGSIALSATGLISVPRPAQAPFARLDVVPGIPLDPTATSNDEADQAPALIGRLDFERKVVQTEA